MLEIRASRAGPPTAIHDGVALTSLYDPVREAERFVAAQVGDEHPATVLILGEVLGYLAGAAQARHPEARIVVLYYDADLASRAQPTRHPTWHPGLDLGAHAFLRGVLGVMDMEGLRFLEWAPSRSLRPKVGRAVADALAQTARELNGTIATTLRSGRRWLRNSVINAIHAPYPPVTLTSPPGRPVVIAGSGPSLEEAIDVLRRHREGLALWALPSAVACLLSGGIQPDVVVMTDPVYWSVYHLHAAAGSDLVVAMPLAASPGVWRVCRRVVYLAQPTFYESALLRALGVSAPAVSPHGTVAGTALELALAHTASSPVTVIMAGLDLCARDIRSHCRPNAFEHVLNPLVQRTSPLSHLLASRTLDTAPRWIPGTDARTSLPLETYAGWFAAGQPTWGDRVRRLFPSPIALPGMPPIQPEEIARMAGGRETAYAGAPPVPEPSGEDRRGAVRDIVSGWRAAIHAARDKPQDPGPVAMALARELGLAAMIELKGRLRRGDRPGAREVWADLVRDLDTFLAEVADLARGDGD